MTYLNCQCSDASLSQKFRTSTKAGAESLIAPIWFYIEIIQACDKAAVFHRVFESEHDMSDVLIFRLDYPDVPQAFISENSCKCPTRTSMVEAIARFSVELSHQAYQQRDIVGTRASNKPLTIIESRPRHGGIPVCKNW